MTIDKKLIRAFPPISARVNEDNTGVFMIGTNEELVSGSTPDDVRRLLISMAQDQAQLAGRPIRVTTHDGEGLEVLIVSPKGEVELESSEVVTARATVPAPAEAELVTSSVEGPSRSVEPHGVGDAPSAVSSPTSLAVPVFDAPQTPEPSLDLVPAEEVSIGDPAPTDAVMTRPESQVLERESAVEEPAPTSRRALREAGSFLSTNITAEPATQGFRGLFNSFGFSLAPSDFELNEREDIRQVSKHFAGTRTVAVVNQKGGANKTPTVAMLAAAFGRQGASVLAWDNNPSTGSLAWRTQEGDHVRSALDVIANAEALLSPTAQSADINAFVHHQSMDKYDVLRSDQDIQGTHVVTAEEVNLLHRVAAKYYRLILMDSGNNHRTPDWTRTIDHAEQVVVATTTEEDRVEGALLTLKGLDLRDERSAALAKDSVVIVSERLPKEAILAQEMADKFRPYVREVVTVPFDRALTKRELRFGALQPATQRAWVRAAAAVARGL
ncbi:MinD/ParA family protein [Arthrobacter sp. NPDC092385]|uniref:MinD/ParA family ATP-binding protein n=1 Tax=Arthrobacter sp. NPDC092385 TaxID=3363943 RepID=UPI0037F99BE9